ncbi:MAG: flap endonuclease [Acidimicrobiia bacterium]|nr:flap endonuclease [Acidimicrobiia bacterium]
MIVHLVDGTYELFRHFFGAPSRKADDGREVAATGGVLASMVQLLEDGATHVGVATDHVIESWRNDVFAGYKSGAGVDPELKQQFPLLEEALDALGLTVWPEVTYEADDAMAAAAAVAARDERVSQVQIMTPDKDLAQCVRGDRVVQVDRRKGTVADEAAVRARYGVPPTSIPDWLALVGDSADGFPGLPGFGAKSASAVLGRYGTLDQVPADAVDWQVTGVRGPAALAMTLRSQMADALLYRRLATLDVDGPHVGAVDEWGWKGPGERFEDLAGYLGAGYIIPRVRQVARDRGHLA